MLFPTGETKVTWLVGDRIRILTWVFLMHGHCTPKDERASAGHLPNQSRGLTTTLPADAPLNPLEQAGWETCSIPGLFYYTF